MNSLNIHPSVDKVDHNKIAIAKFSETVSSLKNLNPDINHIELNHLITRIIFCCFANTTGLIRVLKNTPEQLIEFINQDAIEKFTSLKHNKCNPTIQIDSQTINPLTELCSMNWSKIEPSIFGTLFQHIVDPDHRHTNGQHYTDTDIIQRVTHPLFFENLNTDLNEIIASSEDNRVSRLLEFNERIGQIKIADFACGSANFLISAYQDLRRLEDKVHLKLDGLNSSHDKTNKIKLCNFIGIEIDELACSIANLALILTKQQLDLELKNTIPNNNLEACIPTIINGDSLTLDWNQVTSRASNDEEIYIVGNPPFLGFNHRTPYQNKIMGEIFKDFNKYGILDFAACWFWKGAQFIANSKAKLALISTNSTNQGEQVAILWEPILKLGCDIHFAYQSFPWRNNASSNAAVHVIIVGLSAQNEPIKKLYKVSCRNIEKIETHAISPHLIPHSNLIVKSRKTTLSHGAPQILLGNVPVDGGNLLLDDNTATNLIKTHPELKPYIRRLVGSVEHLKNIKRWCLWLYQVEDQHILKHPEVLIRTNAVAEMRSKSIKGPTRAGASTPHLLQEIRQKQEFDFILIPKVSSENRQLIPLGFYSKEHIIINGYFINGGLYDFGILSSLAHNDWMRATCGRLKSDYSYSSTLVFNNFIWPIANDDQKLKIENLAKNILIIREKYLGSMTLGDMYHQHKMPQELKNAHDDLDCAVDIMYSGRKFKNSSDRTEFLFELYLKNLQTSNTSQEGILQSTCN